MTVDGLTRIGIPPEENVARILARSPDGQRGGEAPSTTMSAQAIGSSDST
jgi:hypothetical protein